MKKRKLLTGFALIIMITCLTGTGCCHKPNTKEKILEPGSVKFKVVIQKRV